MKKRCQALVAVLALSVPSALADEFLIGPPDPAKGGVRRARLGPGMDNLHRYHVPAADQQIPPRAPVTRETYLKTLKGWRYHITNRPLYESFCDAQQAGVYAPRHAFPGAVLFKATGERRLGEKVKWQIKTFYEALKKQVGKTGQNHWYMHYPTPLEIQHRILKEGGILTPEDEKWWRDMVLLQNRTIHVWGTAPTYWRGPMHRSQGEGVMKRMAALKYPDAPETREWTEYADTVWLDWWKFRDNPINDTGYFFGMMFPVVLGAHLMDRTEVFTDPGMKPLWERLLHSVSPDGAVIPYGAHGGWNSGADNLLWMFELAARHTRDGRFRWVAHRLFNYIQYQSERLQSHHMSTHFTKLGIALAWLYADGSVRPVEPEARSMVTWRKETLRVRGKEGAKHYHDNLDPRDDRAQICCGLIVTDQVMPHKLIFRSGWEPGDLFMFVDLFPRHDPVNPGGILGITHQGSALTMTLSSKSVTDWNNMLMVEDLSGTAAVRSNKNPHTIDAFAMSVKIPVFTDRKLATHAVTQTTDYIGFPIINEREFFFVKNRFVLVRDRALFEEGFLVRLGPLWYTENVGPQIGPHWANAFLDAPQAHGIALRNAPWDLLVCHSPKPGRELVVRPRRGKGNYFDLTGAAESTIQYRWQGATTPGQTVQFSQVLLPHAPSRKPAQVAEGIQFLKDDEQATVVKIVGADGRVEWVVLNGEGAALEFEGLKTDARQAYVDTRKGAVKRYLAASATRLEVGKKVLLEGAERTAAEKGEVER